MSTHNICFCGEIRKILSRYPFLSGAMPQVDMQKCFFFFFFFFFFTKLFHISL